MRQLRERMAWVLRLLAGRRATSFRSLLHVGLLIGLLPLSGCTFGGPKSRLGSLPFPGALTLWETADPASLGKHVSEPLSFAGIQESSRGTVYTCKAGFIDLAHLRESADWTRYAHDEVLHALQAKQTSVRFTDHFQGEYEVLLSIPRSWDRLSAADRRVEEGRAARLAGQRVAYLAMTWHEVATWFGERIIPFIPEDRSSFTYDDVIAHVIGVRLGGEALELLAMGDAQTFDDAMSVVLDREMERLGALSAEETREAAERVRGLWWDGEQCMKRQLTTGLDEKVIEPWIVPGFGPCSGQRGEPQRLTWEEPRATLRVAGVVTDVRMRSERYASTLGLERPGLESPDSDAASAHRSDSPRFARRSAGAAPDRPKDYNYAPVDNDGWAQATAVMHAAMRIVRATMQESLGVAFDRP